MKLKVLHVINTICTSNGMMAVIMNYYRHINRDKIQFDFIVNEKVEPNYEKEIKELGGNIYYTTQITLKSTKKYIKDLDEFYYKYGQKYNIIHVHSLNEGIFHYKIGKKYKNFIYIAHSHSTKYATSKLKSIRNYILVKNFSKKADFKLACSNDAKKIISNKHNLKNIHILTNAIEIDKFKYNDEIRKKMREKIKIHDEEILIGNVGRFSNEKNQEFLIDIFQKIYEINDKVKLMLIGKEDEEKAIRKKIEDLKLNNRVMILGVKNNISDFMQAMDIFVLPSKFEGLGLVAIEAQASGLSTIVSTEVPKETGITDKITYIPLNVKSEEWAKKILDSAYRSSRIINTNQLDSYNIYNNIEKLENIYAEVIK